jgi:hypothetical protein
VDGVGIVLFDIFLGMLVFVFVIGDYFGAGWSYTPVPSCPIRITAYPLFFIPKNTA